MGADDASQRMFGCLCRVLCDSHGPVFETHTSAKRVYLVIVLRPQRCRSSTSCWGWRSGHARACCCIVQAEARGLYDVTTNARASGTLHARCARHVDFVGPWPIGASRVFFFFCP